jgi:hypothetical protein
MEMQVGRRRFRGTDFGLVFWNRLPTIIDSKASCFPIVTTSVSYFLVRRVRRPLERFQIPRNQKAPLDHCYIAFS